MQIEQLLILLPCHSLDDFPIYHEDEEAEQLLASWASLWHPALIDAAGSMPAWSRADDAPMNTQNHLIVVPRIAHDELQSGFVARVENEGGRLIQDFDNRQQAIGATLNAMKELTGNDPAFVSDEVLAKFMAVGFAYLQVELLTRQMRYSSSLDQHHFESQLVEAAKAAVAGDSESVDRCITACIDSLGQERDHYYPVDVHVVDLTLAAPSVLMKLDEQLHVKTNLMISGDLLAKVGEEQPSTLQFLKEQLSSGMATIVGGESSELPLPLLSAEAIRRHFIRSLAQQNAILGERPMVYGRRRYGLTPLLPVLLNDFGFIGAIHATLDDGQFPESTQTKAKWEGFGEAVIDSIAKAPLDAKLPQTFLKFAVELSDSMDHDHVATRVLAHWPGQRTDWHNDLLQVAAKSPVLGTLGTLKSYFEDTGESGEYEQFRVSQYRSPYLRQAVAAEKPNPLSHWVEYNQTDRTLRAREGLNTLSVLASGKACDESLDADWYSHIDSIESQTGKPGCTSIDAETKKQIAERLGSSDGDGILVVNPHSFVRRTLVDSSALVSPPAVEKPVYASSPNYVVVDVPPMGFAWVGAGGKAKSKKKEPKIVEELTLRNEFFNAAIDKETGAIRSIRDYKSRGSRGGQQIVVRFPKGDERSSVMAADEVKVIENNPIVGCIEAKGRLLDKEGKLLSGFQAAYRVERGNRVMMVDIELQPEIELGENPWESYIASRLAWASEAGEIFTDLHQTRNANTTARLESPTFVEIDEADRRTLVLTEGLPYHRRVGSRMLDTLLMVRGETQTTFRIGIGSDVPYPLRESLVFRQTPIVIPGRKQPSSSASTWLAHIDSKNVVMSSCEPVSGDDGNCNGLLVRLQETEGRKANATIRICRQPKLATQQTLEGQDVSELDIEDSAVKVRLNSRQWTQVKISW